MGSVVDTLPETAWRGLDAAVAGDVVRPGAAAYHGPNRERLLRVKRRYDPDDVFSAAPR